MILIVQSLFAPVFRLDDRRQLVVIVAARDRKAISLDARAALQNGILDKNKLE